MKFQKPLSRVIFNFLGEEEEVCDVINFWIVF